MTLDQQIYDAGHYEPGGSHAIVKVPGSKWLIVDSWYEMHTDNLLGLGVHYDGDDPAHEFLGAERFGGSQKLADDYNAPFRRSLRLKDCRATSVDLSFPVLKRHFAAKRAMQP